MNYKIIRVNQKITIPIKYNAENIRVKFSFLSKDTFTQYIQTNIENYEQIILNIKYNQILKNAVYSFLDLDGQLLAPYFLLQDGFLLDSKLYAEIKPFQIFFYKGVVFVVNVIDVIGYYKDLQDLHKDNIMMVLK